MVQSAEPGIPDKESGDSLGMRSGGSERWTRAHNLLVYDGGMNVVFIDYRETIMTEDVNEQMTDDRIREKGKRSCFYSVWTMREESDKKNFSTVLENFSSTWDEFLLACNKKTSEVVSQTRRSTN